jgi:CelD/BcsL family acetyltransferase involved in cellulose biosynthesis
MKDLNKAYWTKRGQTAAFAYPFFESFHKRLIRTCLPRATVELLRIAVGDQPIGYLYNFVHNARVYAYQSAFLYEDDPKLKPGLVCHHLCIERHLQDRAHFYDFLAGDSRYKANLGTPGVDMLDVICQRPLIKLRLEHTLRKVKRGLRIRLQRLSGQ